MSVIDELDIVLNKMKEELESSDTVDERLLQDYMGGLKIKLQLLQAEETKLKFDEEKELREKELQIREKELENSGKITPSQIFAFGGDLLKTAVAFVCYGALLTRQNYFEHDDSYSLSGSKDLGRQFHTLLPRR